MLHLSRLVVGLQVFKCTVFLSAFWYVSVQTECLISATNQICCIRVFILHQSDCHIRVCILHQSYYSIRISYTVHSIWVLFSCKLCHWIRGPCTKNGLNQKFWAHLLSVMVFGLCLKVEIYQDMVGSHLTFCIIFKLKHVFSFLLLMIHMLNNSHSIEYHGNNVQNPIRTYPIIHDMNTMQFFMCLNCTSPIKFHFAPLDFALSCVISL